MQGNEEICNQSYIDSRGRALNTYSKPHLVHTVRKLLKCYKLKILTGYFSMRLVQGIRIFYSDSREKYFFLLKSSR